MCGIVGYVGARNAKDVVMSGLNRLEYRGYDSAGIALSLGLLEGKNITSIVQKAQGRLKILAMQIAEQNLTGFGAIGHTRWATHGAPSDINAHPHKYGRVTLVHNGIIENYADLKNSLIKNGHVFSSQTDTEIAAHLLDNYLVDSDEPLKAIARLCENINGASAFAIIISGHEDKVFFAKLGAPMIVARSKDGCYLASDQAALVDFQPLFYALKDQEIGFISADNIYVQKLNGEQSLVNLIPMLAKREDVEKMGYKHFMHKEIFEQPQTVQNVLLGRIKNNQINYAGFALDFTRIKTANRIQIIACGSSYLAGIIARNELEALLRIPVEVDIASEYRYRATITDAKTLVIAISQSGETADTMAALHKASHEGAMCMAICNVLGSAIANICEPQIGTLYLNAGPEISVASTKASVAQIVALKLLTLAMAKDRGLISLEQECANLLSLTSLKESIAAVLLQDDHIRNIAKNLLNAPRMLYLGRGESYGVALEGALKMKELAYIFAEGYPAGELKHGPIATIDQGMPAVVIFSSGELAIKTASNLAEIKARGAKIITIAPRSVQNIREESDYFIELEDCGAIAEAVLSVIPLQLLAYHLSDLKNIDVDKPRNLAKSVTVE